MAIDPGSHTSWITSIITQIGDWWKTYINPADTEEDDEYETVYVTEIRYLGPVRETKYILVNEMPSFFTDEQLNVGYHTKEEYVQANDKYGYIYKHQKFENADTVEKLQEYATDWIKNNYHGGLTSFDITAVDMHLMNEDVDQYSCGDQIDVYYPDPDLRQEVQQTLTCISAEYDLYNPDKDKYKIGIPDSTLSKVYGETVKSGGGGGGGKNNEEENDEEDDTEEETLQDRVQKLISWLDENGWSFWSKHLPGGEDGTEQSDPNLRTPKSRDVTNPFEMNLMADNLAVGLGKFARGEINNLKSAYTNITGTLTAAKANIKNLSYNGKSMTVNGSKKFKDVNGNEYSLPIIKFGDD